MAGCEILHIPLHSQWYVLYIYIYIIYHISIAAPKKIATQMVNKFFWNVDRLTCSFFFRGGYFVYTMCILYRSYTHIYIYIHVCNYIHMSPGNQTWWKPSIYKFDDYPIKTSNLQRISQLSDWDEYNQYLYDMVLYLYMNKIPYC